MRFDGVKFTAPGQEQKSFQYHVSSIIPEKGNQVFFTDVYDGVFRYSNGRYNLVFKSTEAEGDYKQMVRMDNRNFVVVTNRSIFVINEKGNVIREFQPRTKENIDLVQMVKVPKGILIFTTVGNYIVRNNRIIPCASWYKGAGAENFYGRFATCTGNKVTIYDALAQHKLVLALTGTGEVISARRSHTYLNANLDLSDPIRNVIAGRNTIFLLTRSGRLCKIERGSFANIEINYPEKIVAPNGLYLDRNDDLWMNSFLGLFKISKEAFTRINRNTLFHSPNIGSIFRKADGTLLVSKSEELIICPPGAEAKETIIDLQVLHFCETFEGLFLATSTGIYRFKNDKPEPVSFPFQKGKKITLLHWDGSNFWYSAAGEGVVCYDPVTKKTERYANLSKHFPGYFYTAQNNFDRTVIYFGTNEGVFAFNRLKKTMRQVQSFRHLGAFCGNSTTDRFGGLWFTLDKGLAGVTRNGDFVTIEDRNILPSTLFYTLTADNFGNILAGTNLGINVIEVDRNGNVLQHRNYGAAEGFSGYETNMRSKFELGNYCYVGTIEGLYLVNSEVLRMRPKAPKPLILFGRENASGELITSNSKSYYTFKCLLSKQANVLFSWRILGFDDSWSDFSPGNELELPDLPDGKYQLEVRASYDGSTISEISRHPFTITIPIWQSKWFFVLLVVLLGIINLVYLEWSKSFISANIFNTKDLSIEKRFLPRLILFGLVINSGALMLLEWVEPTLFSTININILFTTCLGLIYIASIVNLREISRRNYSMFFFLLAYLLIATENYVLLYQSDLHPYPLLMLTIFSSLIPFITVRIGLVITISLSQLLVAALMLIWIENPVFSELLFISAIGIACAIYILISYLRNDSMEKLIFVSGVINNGNVMVISFDNQGLIRYCSENIREFFNVDATSLVGQHSSILNPFIVTSEMRKMSLRESFEDGKIILIPMYNKTGSVIWIEWSCKFFNDNVRVIMGQDITEKVTLSTNYEVLVENAQDLIYNTDLSANFLFANNRCLELFGYRNDTLIGKNSLAIVAPDYREKVHKFYTEQFENRVHHTYLEFPIKSRDGRVFWLGQNVTMLYEAGSRKRVSGFLAVARNITEKRANDLLIEQQNKDITASITYAKRIQYNLLPDKQFFTRHFDDSFVLFKPKDIVSGDFYWTEELGDKLLVVLADCTGHGVPGAFMTLLGINLLNQIVRERKIIDPAEILNQLNTELSAILPTSEGTVMYDDMDALVALFSDGEMCYASSGVSFIHNRNGELDLYRPSRSLDHSSEHMPVYTSSCIQLDPEDTLYLFTDGYQKQFGSIRNKKFSYKRMLELISQVKSESLPLQKKYFENALRNWSEGHEQTDDITVIGLKGRK